MKRRSQFETPPQLDSEKLFTHYSLANLTWQLISSAGSNKIFSRKGLIAIYCLEGVLSIFYALLMISKLQCNFIRQVSIFAVLFFAQRKNDWNMSNTQCVTEGESMTGTSFTLLRSFLNAAEANEAPQALFLSTAILILNLSLIISMFILLKRDQLEKQQFAQRSKQQKKESKSKSSAFESLICFLLIVEGRFLYIPVFDVISRSFFADNAILGDIVIIQQIINSATLITQLAITLYSNRLLALNMPSFDFAPWSISSSSSIEYLKFFAKIATPVLLAVDRSDTNIGLWLIGNLCLQALYLISSLYVTSQLDINQAAILKFSQSTVVVILEVGVVSYIIGESQSSEELTLIIVMIVFQAYSIYEWNRQRQHNLIVRLKENGTEDIKLEIECEQLILHIITLCESTLYENKSDLTSMINSNAFSQIITIWDHHYERCSKEQNHCQCTKVHEYVKLIKENQRNGSRSDYIVITQKKLNKNYKLLASEIDNSKHYISGMANLVDYDKRIKEQNMNLGIATQDSAQRNDQPDIIVSISIDALKKRLIDSILNLTLKELRNKFPRSLKLYELALYSRMSIIRQPYLCLNIMRTFQGDRYLSFFDRVSKIVNDRYILSKLNFSDSHIQYKAQQNSQLVDIESNNELNKAKDIDIDHFLQLDQLQIRFNEGLEDLKNASQELWVAFTDTKSIIDPNNALHKGYKFAKEIKYIDRNFKILESFMIRKDPIIYFQYAKIHKLILNDDAQSGLLSQKMRNLQEMKKIYDRNRDTSNFEEDCPFAIVNANVNKIGSIIQMNESCQKLVGRSSSEGLKINSIMPSLIGIHHDQFINAFNKYGETKILNQMTAQQIVDRKGHLIPIQLMVKMHFSHQHNICFFGLLKPIENMNPFLNGYQYPTNQLAIFTFSLDDGKISEFSTGFLDLLKQAVSGDVNQIAHLNNAAKIIEDAQMKIDDLIIDFDMKDYQNKLKDIVDKGFEETNLDYESVHTFDISAITNSNILVNRQRENMETKFQVRICIRSEQLFNGLVNIGYAIMIIEDARFNEHQRTQNLMNSPMKSQQSILVNGQPIIGSFQEEAKADGDDSVSTSSNSYSYPNTQLSNAGKQQGIPKTLKIVIQLVLALFLVSIVIATINLVLNAQNKEQGVITVKFSSQLYSRMNFTSNSRLVLRSLLNMANGYEQMNTTMIEDRWGFYSNMLAKLTDQLKDVQNQIDRNILGYQESQQYKELKLSKNIKLNTINGLNLRIYLNTTLSEAMNLYTGKLQQLETGKIETLKGNLNIQSLRPILKNYKPTFEEQMIYFAIKNSNSAIKTYNLLHTQQVDIDADLTLEYYSRISLITTLVSIFSIFFVILAISPIISRTEERRYLALSFFLKIPIEKRLEFLSQCRDINIQTRDHAKYDGEPSQVRSSNYLSSMLDSSEKSQTDQNFKSIRIIGKNNEKQIDIKKISTDQLVEQQDFLGRQLSNKQVATKNEDELQIEDIQDGKSEIQTESLKIIEKVAKQKKNRSLIQLVFAIIIFTGYFLGSYFMALKNFQAASRSIADLNTVFFKESCFEYMVSYLREEQIRNATEAPKKGPTLQDGCIEKERKYLELRKNTPQYLLSAKSAMNDIEQADFCARTFKEPSELAILASCKQAINGLLSTGLSNTMSFMYRFIDQTQRNYDSQSRKEIRDEAYLLNELRNPVAIELIDVKMYLFCKPFETLKSAIMTSIEDYLSSTMKEIIVLYSVFMAFLVICLFVFFVFVIKRLRETMWNTNLLLRVIPAQNVLDKIAQDHLVKFFVT